MIWFHTSLSLELRTWTFISTLVLLRPFPLSLSLWDDFFPIFSHHRLAYALHLSFIVLGFNLAYIALNSNGSEMIPTKKCIVNYLAPWAIHQLLQIAVLPSHFAAPPSQLDYFLPMLPHFSINTVLWTLFNPYLISDLSKSFLYMHAISPKPFTDHAGPSGRTHATWVNLAATGTWGSHTLYPLHHLQEEVILLPPLSPSKSIPIHLLLKLWILTVKKIL